MGGEQKITYTKYKSATLVAMWKADKIQLKIQDEWKG